MRPLANQVTNKITYISIGIFLALTIIVVRLFHLQVTLMPRLYNQGQKNCLRIEKIDSPRGNILDIQGIPLATNRPITNLYWRGTGKKILDGNDLAILNTVEAILGTEIINNHKLYNTILDAERTSKRIAISSDLTFEQLSQIAEQINYPSILLLTHFKRHYPYGTCASHILGYLGSLDFGTIGKMGLEKLLEDTLKGEPGIVVKTINSCGKNLAEAELKKALAGQDIRTTIDLNLQQLLEQVFPDDDTGTFIVMDPEDGALKALVSRPNFDPNIFLQPIPQEEWEALYPKKPFINRAFNACYPPGSIFKLVTSSAGLEHKIISPNSSVFCSGAFTFGNRVYHCHKKEGHGELTATQAVAYSCNPFFYKIGTKIDIDALADYANRFGLGQKSNTLFSEYEGLIPSRKWKRSTKGEKWFRGDTLSVAIGQSYLLVTPIQIARMISSIFTGYLVTPRILVNEPVVKQPLNIRRDTLSFLRNSMKLVVTRGTSQRVNLHDLVIYAKTSTAQTSSLDKHDLGKAYRHHGWFVANFYYKDNKPLTLVILVENADSSSYSINLAVKFLHEYMKIMDHPKQSPQKA